MNDPIDEPKTNLAPEPTAVTRPLSRRGFVRAGVGGTGLIGAAAFGISTGGFAQRPQAPRMSHAGPHGAGAHPMPTVVGEVDHVKNGFNPTELLSDFDSGTVSTLPSGQTLREYTLIAQNKMFLTGTNGNQPFFSKKEHPASKFIHGGR